MGSLGLPVAADSSTARMTTEPLWRMTSRVLRWPVGSMTVSVKTEKTLPFQASLEEMSLAFLAFAGAFDTGWGTGFAVEAGEGVFFEAAIKLRYHPHLRPRVGHPICCNGYKLEGIYSAWRSIAVWAGV